MSFVPTKYSDINTNLNLTDGTNKQRAEAVIDLTDWTLVEYNENKSSAIATDGTNKQRVNVVYNLGAGSGGSGGGITQVVHDATLSGSGTEENPLKVADDTYLPLSGGTLTGVINFSGTGINATLLRDNNRALLQFINATMGFGLQGSPWYSMGSIRPYSQSYTLGNEKSKWGNAYTAKINNGADIEVPNKAGTMALVEDIEGVVGDISSVLDTINGEVI